MKKYLKILTVVAIMILCLNFVSASTALVGTGAPNKGTANTEITDAAGIMWSTVLSIVQILAFAAIIFAGIRYMFASADAKADIKKQTVILVIGAAIVFAAGPLVQFISDVANDILE